MNGDQYLSDGEFDSDRDDLEPDDQLETWLGQLQKFNSGVDDVPDDVVKRRLKTVVTSEMALESFRCSVLYDADPEDVNLDAILGELTELEQKLTDSQYELSSLCPGDSTMPQRPLNPNRFTDASSELSKLRINSQYSKFSPNCRDYDNCENDSAYSDNNSLPSSGSFTSVVTVSSSADTSVSGDTYNGTLQPRLLPHGPVILSHEDEQRAKLKEEKIRLALEKIRDGNIKKIFVRAFSRDGSSKSILVDETMTIGHICNILSRKNHQTLTVRSTIVEVLPELFMERTLEDHDSLVEVMISWSQNSANKIVFEERSDKYDLFLRPEKYLLSSGSQDFGSLMNSDPRVSLIEELFCNNTVKIPEVEGPLYLKIDGKKSWKKYFCVLSSSGIYYNTKGKMTKKPSKDMDCLVMLKGLDIYRGIGWKKKYSSPTDFTFAIKHPQFQKKSSKYIRYFCAENQNFLDKWMNGLRIAKNGKQLLDNYEIRKSEIRLWDMDIYTHPNSIHSVNGHEVVSGVGGSSVMVKSDSYSASECSDSHLRSSTSTLIPDGQDDDADSVTYYNKQMLESGDFKSPPKRVSFDTAHSVIQEGVDSRRHHRDSITSSSTDTSDESYSSNESRASQVRRLRAKLPLTTGTTRLISEMCQTTHDNNLSSLDGTPVERKPLGHNSALRISQRRKSAPSLDVSPVTEPCIASKRPVLKPNSPVTRDSSMQRRNSSPKHSNQQSVDRLSSLTFEDNSSYSHVTGSKPMQRTVANAEAYQTPQRRKTSLNMESGGAESTSPRQSYQVHRKSLSSSAMQAGPDKQNESHMWHSQTVPQNVIEKHSRNKSSHNKSNEPPPVPMHNHPTYPCPLPPIQSESPRSSSELEEPTLRPPPPDTLPKPTNRDSNMSAQSAIFCDDSLPPPPPSMLSSLYGSLSNEANSIPPPTAAKPRKSSWNSADNYNQSHLPHLKSMPPAVAPKPNKKDPFYDAPSNCVPPQEPSPDYSINSPIFDGSVLPLPPENVASLQQVSSEPFLQELVQRHNLENIYSNIDDKTSSNSQVQSSMHFPLERRGSDSSIKMSYHSADFVLRTPNSKLPVEATNSVPLPKSSQKAVPPAPPKRSDSTRLSVRTIRPPVVRTSSTSSSDSLSLKDSNQTDGIIPIDDLPPPPAELLEGLLSDKATSIRTSKPIPPPPPKRSKDTQLSSQT